MRAFKTAVLIGASALGAACASLPIASPEATAAARTFIPDSGQARLYVVRRSGGTGVFPVVLNGRVAGGLGYHTFLMVEVPPGTHALQSSTGESVARLELTVEADRVYFVEIYRNTNLWDLLGLRGERVALRQIAGDDGRRLVVDWRRVQAEAMR